MIASIVAVGRRFAAEARHDRLDPGAAEAVEGEPGHVRVGGERRLTVRPTGQEEQDPGVLDPVQTLLDHLERGRVDPVRVLDDHQHRLPGRKPEHLLDQRLEGPRPLRLRRQIERAIACPAVEAEQVGDQGRGAVPARPLEQGLQLVQPRLERIVRSQARRMVQLLDHRPERAVGVVGRALVANPKVRSSVRASSRARLIRDLPMPASPTSSTPWPSPALASAQRSSSSASS